VAPACCTGANALARFADDPLGRRVEKVAAGVTHSYVYDGIDILQETVSAGGTPTTYRYFHGPGIDEPLAREEVGPGTLTYYHADGLGSIVKMTNQAGAVVHSYQYDAWGNIEVGASHGGYAFTGREWDPETGLYYYRARSYDPEVGRSVSEDPIGFAGGANYFGYLRNRPVGARDPLGLVGPDKMIIFDANEGRPLDEPLSQEAREGIANLSAGLGDSLLIAGGGSTARSARCRRC
jgi:RHS repeat-associated protein